jgi:hypothetical protein
MIAAFLSGALIRSKAGIVFILTSHSIWTNSEGRFIADAETTCEYTSFTKFDTITSWSEYHITLFPAIAHFRGAAFAQGNVSCGNHTYEFVLIETTHTNKKTIEGTWNVYRDNSLVCSSCNGSALDLNDPVGSAYRVEVDDPIYGVGTWQYQGFITLRKDFTNP